jgi:TrmH family RNA methyltransferase
MPSTDLSLSCFAMNSESAVRRQLRSPAEIEEALAEGRAVRFVLCLETGCDEATLRAIARAESLGVAVRRITTRAMRRLLPSGVETQILGLEGPAPASSLTEVMRGSGVVWMLVGCGYPGNAGYVIRCAEVSGADGVVIASEFDRVERRDCLRYGMRVDRFFPVHFADAEATVALARESGRNIVAVEDVGKLAPWQADLSGRLLIMIGGEEGGIPESILSGADCVLRIPMNGFLPSYNLQAAMAVVMGERLRQIES